MKNVVTKVKNQMKDPVFSIFFPFVYSFLGKNNFYCSLHRGVPFALWNRETYGRANELRNRYKEFDCELPNLSWRWLQIL